MRGAVTTSFSAHLWERAGEKKGEAVNGKKKSGDKVGAMRL